ncbi:MAG: hypothetical protein CMJ18_17300 [Phycisphaeraceae bacterium]|nr:hypothetical protein [Phycisphaeraceae bacterium]
MSDPKRRALWLAIACGVGLAGTGGCNYVAFLGQAFPQKVPATYSLPRRPTVVLVDDPRNLLGDPTLSVLIAQQIGDDLGRHAGMEQIVPPERVTGLMVRLEDDWRRTGVDQIGRSVGAAQVVHVHIERAVLSPDPGLVQPMAVAQVKVIDAANRRRMFPGSPIEAGDDPDLVPSGQRVRVELLPRAAEITDATRQAYQRKLADRIARDVGRLFYAYLPRQPGEPFE